MNSEVPLRLTQTLLELLTLICVRLLSSTGTGTSTNTSSSTNTSTGTSTSTSTSKSTGISTSTSTRLLQVPMINRMSSVRHVLISLPFGHN